MENQVKPRFDGQGSEFGLVHRKLPQRCAMFDLDRMSATAVINLELKQQDIAFLEYRTNFQDSTIEWRALFEIKFKDSEWVQKAISCGIGTATWAQLKLCERLGARYFIVIANRGIQPFVFYEINYQGDHRIIGELNYNDKNTDGIDAINNFWKNNLKLL